jgi:hypothetical protein
MKQNIYKNAGFPPIKYCHDDKIESISKERFLGTVPHQELNIKQLLNTNKKPIIVDINDEDLEIIESI